MIIAKWHPNEDEDTSVKFARAFSKLNKIEKLDFLQDVIAELHRKYEFVLGVEDIK